MVWRVVRSECRGKPPSESPSRLCGFARDRFVTLHPSFFLSFEIGGEGAGVQGITRGMFGQFVPGQRTARLEDPFLHEIAHRFVAHVNHRGRVGAIPNLASNGMM